jgi:hypothetical protein
MRAASLLRIAIALMLGLSAAAAQQPLETRGAWRLVPDGEDFAARTQAVGAPDTMLSLYCRKPDAYALAIKSATLADQPSGEDIRISFKVDDSDQTWFNLTTAPDGTVPISHQTAFWIIYPALTRNDAKTVTFTARDHGWQFALDGLKDLVPALSARCGFEPMQPEPQQRRTRPGGPTR